MVFEIRENWKNTFIIVTILLTFTRIRVIGTKPVWVSWGTGLMGHWFKRMNWYILKFKILYENNYLRYICYISNNDKLWCSG